MIDANASTLLSYVATEEWDDFFVRIIQDTMVRGRNLPRRNGLLEYKIEMVADA